MAQDHLKPVFTDSLHAMAIASLQTVKRYRNSVIFCYINRAYKITQKCQDIHQELKRIKQLLININYSNLDDDMHIRNFLDKKNCNQDLIKTNQDQPK